MSDVKRGNRPLSPHLEIYRPQMSSVSSILIRLSGIGLVAGLLMLAVWLCIVSCGPETYERYSWLFENWIANLIWMGSIWALIYHMLGGIRHWVYDLGFGFDLKTSDLMGWGMVLGSVVITAGIVGTVWS